MYIYVHLSIYLVTRYITILVNTILVFISIKLVVTICMYLLERLLSITKEYGV